MTSNKYKNHCLYCFSGFSRSREKSSRGKFLKSRVAWTVNADSPAVGRSDNQQKGWVGKEVFKIKKYSLYVCGDIAILD